MGISAMSIDSKCLNFECQLNYKNIKAHLSSVYFLASKKGEDSTGKYHTFKI